jgi:multiple sugar transport system ATP-binding protein
MNFFAATITNGGSTLQAGTFTLPVPQALRGLTGGRDGQKIVAGIRPENLLDPDKPARGETARLTVEVEISEPLGHEVVVHGRIGEDRLVAKLDPHRVPEMGASIEIVVELESLHLFDAKTEKRLTSREDPS